MKISKKLTSWLLVLVMIFSVSGFTAFADDPYAPEEIASEAEHYEYELQYENEELIEQPAPLELVDAFNRGTPTMAWTENFEHNSIGQLQWSYGGGTRVPSPNNRDFTVQQSIVAQTGVNSDAQSLLVGRYFATGNNDRQGRLIFDNPIVSNAYATLTFDWLPNAVTAQSRYGQLAVQSINHFNSLNYITFLTIPDGQLPAGLSAGLYFVVGTTRNVPVADLGLTAENFITTNVSAWYTVELDFNFIARTINLVMTNTATDEVVINRGLNMAADENYAANQITGLQFFTGRVANTGSVGWETFLDNITARAYDDPTAPHLNTHPFGMPRNVVYSPVTYNSVTISWDSMYADGFHIYRRHATDARNSIARIATVTDGFSFVDSTVTGPFYFYQVAAFNSEGVSERTLEAFIQLAADPHDGIDDFTLLSEFDTSSFAGFGNRIRLGDLDGDGRMDILLANTLTMGGRNWAPGFPNRIPGTGGTPAEAGIATGGDGGNPRVIFSLTAVDIEGNILWQRCAATGFTGFDGHSREIGTGADEPVQIGDVTGDGFNNVILVANEGIQASAEWSAANPWINQVPPATLANPDFTMPTNYVDRFYRTDGDVFYILDGRTGEIAVDINGRPMYMSFADIFVNNPGIPATNFNHLHDHITLADLDGRGIRQHVLVGHRYQRTTAFEMINRDGEFVMRFMWQYYAHPAGMGGGDTAPHFPLAAPLFRDQGDNRDWIYNNWELLHPETGQAMWRVPNGVRSQLAPHTWDPGGLITRSSHMDSIWAADLFGTGEYAIVKGVDNDNHAVVAVTREGDVLWFNACPVEAQSANPAWFRTDAPGMMSVGLDRRQRGAFPMGHDGLFLLDAHGNTVFQEVSNFQGWMTTTFAMSNWSGTFSPMIFAFNRNYHVIEYVGGGGNPAHLDNNIPASFYDGYFNQLFTLPELVGWTALRWKPANLIGDSREELVSFSDRGHIFVFANGEQSLFDGIAGQPRQQTPNLNNWTRYNVGYASTNFEDREAATPTVAVVGSTAEVTITPVIFAISHNLYLNGELVRTFDVNTDNLRHTIAGLTADSIYAITVTATERAPNGTLRTTAPSVPYVVNRHLGEVSFSAEQIGGNALGAGTTGIAITFSAPVTGLTADHIIVQAFAGDEYGSVVTGALTGEGTNFVLAVDEVIKPGKVRVLIVNFDSFFVTTEPVMIEVFVEVPVFTASNPNNLSALLEDGDVILSTPGNLGIFAHHSPFVIPEGRTLTVTTTLNVSGNAELIVEGTIVVADGGRINNQGGSGGSIVIATDGEIINHGHVENVTNSTLINHGTIVNNNRFEVRAGTNFFDGGNIVGDINIHRNAIILSEGIR